MNSQPHRAVPGLLPRMAVLELTYRCNHNCIFCSCPWYAPNSTFEVHKELTVEEWKQTIDTSLESGVTGISLTGGEPLLKEGWEEILIHASQRLQEIGGTEGRLFLLSNGRLMSTDVLKLCAKYHVALSMSLPGLQSFERHTGNAGAKNVLEWFKEAERIGITTTAGITVTKINKGELYDTIGEALLSGASRILLNRFLIGGRGIAYAKELSISTSEVQEMLSTAEQVLKTAGRYGHVGTELPACVANPAGKLEHLAIGTRCSGAVEFCAIDPSGFVRVCNHSPKRLVHVSDLSRLAQNPYWKRFCHSNYLPSSCKACKLASACDGGCREAAHIATGSPWGMEPDLIYRVEPGSDEDSLPIPS